MKALKSATLIIATIALVQTANAEAGPFGLEMGMTLKDIGGSPEQISKGKYRITTVPKPHSAFERYVVQVGPKSGLCFIKAVGKPVETNAYGIELRSAFNNMSAKLTQIYGKQSRMDLLLPGSIWKEPNEFMIGLLKNERKLYDVWSVEHKSSLTGNLESVALGARPLSMDTGSITIDYSFKNKKECDAEIAAEEDGAL